MKTNIKFNRIVIVLLVIIIAITGLCSLAFIYNNSSNTAEINPIGKNEETMDVNRQVEEGKINIQYQLYSIFNGKKSQEFLVRNNPNNHYPIKFNIYDETNDLIYASDELRLGYEVNQIELNKSMKKGEHDCKIEIFYATKGNVMSQFPLKINVI